MLMLLRFRLSRDAELCSVSFNSAAGPVEVGATYHVVVELINMHRATVVWSRNRVFEARENELLMYVAKPKRHLPPRTLLLDGQVWYKLSFNIEVRLELQ